jgi:hypothetical protein
MLQRTESFYLDQLKSKLEEKIGFQVLQFEDCRVLSNLLRNEKINVSAHTLARFYGVLKEAHRPYTSTLNLLADFLGFGNYANFCSQIKRSHSNALANNRGISGGDFSYSALELAIQMNDWKNVQHILENFEYTFREDKNFMTAFLGNSVRQHPHKTKFLKTLFEIENGRLLYFESFVDEDDPGGYYSDALTTFYAQKNEGLQKNLFHSCFINTKKIYLNQNVHKKDIELVVNTPLEMNEFHFHQISRMMELRILMDARNNRIIQKMDKHVDFILDSLSGYTKYEKCWVIARAIKAFTFSNVLDKALEINDFRQAIFDTYQEMKGLIDSVAELIIQLIVHAYPNHFGKSLIPPMRFNTFNENNARIAIESATALIYAENPVKKVIEKNLNSFADKTGNGWIWNLQVIS